MAILTNFTAGAFATSGLAIASGTDKKQVCRKIADAILALTAAPGTRWAEVTAATPTPVFLQAYASTIDATSTMASATDYGLDDQVTLYLKDDPGLSLTTPRARALRIFVGYYGVDVAIADIVSGLAPTWTNTGNNFAVSTPTYYVMPNLGTTATAATTAVTQNNNTRIYLFEGPDHHTILAYDQLHGTMSGGVYLYYPPAPADGHWTRTGIGPLFMQGVAGSYTATYNSESPNLLLANMASNGTVGGVNTMMMLPHAGFYTVADEAGRAVVTAHSMVSNRKNLTTKIIDAGTAPGIRSTRPDTLAAGTEATLGTTPFLSAGNSSGNAVCHLIQTA